MKKENNCGFSIKILIFLLFCVFGCVKKDYEWAERTKLRSIGLTTETFRQSYGRYPDKLEELTKLDSNIHSFTVDEWGTPVRYTVSGDSFTVRSAGPDSKFGTTDDIIVSKEDLKKPAPQATGR